MKFVLLETALLLDGRIAARVDRFICVPIERFPGFRLDNERLEYQPSITFRSLKSLPIHWQ